MAGEEEFTRYRTTEGVGRTGPHPHRLGGPAPQLGAQDSARLQLHSYADQRARSAGREAL
eukprot:6153250-Pyramimonas_sp.AAC.1